MDEAKKRSFAAGYLMGLAGAPVAASDIKKPVSPEDAVAFIYNGVMHPPRPSGYDDLPYTTIMFEEDMHYMYLSDRPFFARPTDDGMGFNLYNNYAEGGIRFQSFQLHVDHYGNEYWYNIGFNILYPEYLVAGPAPDGWAHYDILDLEGNVRIKGTPAIPVGDKPAENAMDNKLLVLGCRLGYVIRAHMGKGKIEIPDGVLVSSDGYALSDSTGRYLCAKGRTPVAFLYNGVRLPPLPEWDGTAYPYAIIYCESNNTTTDYYLRVYSSEPAVYSSANLMLVPYNGGTFQRMYTAFGEGKENSLGAPKEVSYDAANVAKYAIWANFDIRVKGTNNVYFEKSDDPDPVYE